MLTILYGTEKSKFVELCIRVCSLSGAQEGLRNSTKKGFYVPERDIMHLTVSARFLIRFDFRGGGGGGQRVHNVS